MRAFLPNALTCSRGLAGLLVAWLLLVHQANFAAFATFFVAVFTDLFDGWLARKLDAVDAVGPWLDPLADKLLADFTWAALWAIGWAPGWLVGLLIFRDVCVVAGYSAAYLKGHRWKASLTGRIMSSFEAVALAVFLFHGPWLGIHWPTVAMGLGMITVALSVVSALEYLASGPTLQGSSAWPAPPATQTSSPP